VGPIIIDCKQLQTNNSLARHGKEDNFKKIGELTGNTNAI
jgi:hypothetical protein